MTKRNSTPKKKLRQDSSAPLTARATGTSWWLVPASEFAEAARRERERLAATRGTRPYRADPTVGG